MTGAPSRRRPVRELLWLAFACIAATGVLYLLAVHTGPGQRVDNRLQGGIGPGDTGFRAATEDLLATISVSSLTGYSIWVTGKFLRIEPPTNWKYVLPKKDGRYSRRLLQFS